MATDSRAWSLYDLGGALLVVAGVVAVIGLWTVVTEKLPTGYPWFPSEQVLLAVALLVGAVLVGLGAAVVVLDRRRRALLFLGAVVLAPTAFVVLLLLTLVPGFFFPTGFFRNLLSPSPGDAVAFGRPTHAQYAVPGILVATLLGVVAVVNALSLDPDERTVPDLDPRSPRVLGAAGAAVVSMVALAYGVPGGAGVWVVLAVVGLAAGVAAVHLRTGHESGTEPPRFDRRVAGVAGVVALVTVLVGAIRTLSGGPAAWAGVFGVGAAGLVGATTYAATRDRRWAAGALSGALVLVAAVVAAVANAPIAGALLAVLGLGGAGWSLWPAVAR